MQRSNRQPVASLHLLKDNENTQLELRHAKHNSNNALNRSLFLKSLEGRECRVHARRTTRDARGGARKRRKIRVILSDRARTPSRPYMVPMASGIGSQRHPCLIAINASKFPHGPVPNKHHRVPSVYVFNANSLAKPHAKEQLLADLQSNQIDVAIISETKFKKHHKPQFSKLPGYRTYRIDRLGRGGGGGAIFVNNNCASKSLPVSNDSTDLELLWVLVKSEEASTIVGALYHPPKSTCSYPPLLLYNFLEDSIEELLMQNPDASVILVGDFNKLNVAEVTARTSLVPLVHTPTRGNNILDMLMTSLPQLHQIKVVASAVRSDHKAIIATPDGGIRDRTKSSCTKQFRRRTPEMHADLLLYLRDIDFDRMEVGEPQAAWLEFYAAITEWLDHFYPLRSVTITSPDPGYMTPEIKYLLRRRNRLMHHQKIEEAAALSLRIAREIARFNS